MSAEPVEQEIHVIYRCKRSQAKQEARLPSSRGAFRWPSIGFGGRDRNLPTQTLDPASQRASVGHASTFSSGFRADRQDKRPARPQPVAWAS